MTSKAASVAAYVNEVTAERRAAVEKLRRLCQQALQGYEEGMAYGLPCYKRNGNPEVAFASQQNHIALYVMKPDVVDEFRSELSGSSIGKGCIRFSKPERMNFEVLDRLLRRVAASDAPLC